MAQAQFFASQQMNVHPGSCWTWGFPSFLRRHLAVALK
jgi:hypothetical protein